MRRVGPVFAGAAERRESFVQLLCKLGERRAVMYANEERVRTMRIREETKTSDVDRDGGKWRHRGERRLKFRKAILGPFADKFRSNVKVLHSSPVKLRQRAQYAQ